VHVAGLDAVSGLTYATCHQILAAYYQAG
jgi:hypothetical protein